MTSAQVKNASVRVVDLISTANHAVQSGSTVKEFSKMMSAESTDSSYDKQSISSKESTYKSDTNVCKKARAVQESTDTKKSINSDELEEKVEDVISEVKEEIAAYLSISVEKLEQVMQNLNLNDVALFQTASLTQIFTEVTGEEPMAILTNEKLSIELNDFIELSLGKINELSADLGVEKEALLETMKLMENQAELPDQVFAMVDGEDNMNGSKVAELVFENTDRISNYENSKHANIVQTSEASDTNVVASEEGGRVTQSDIQPKGNMDNQAQQENMKDFSNVLDENVKTDAKDASDISGGVPVSFAERMMQELEAAVTNVSESYGEIDPENIMEQIFERVKVQTGKEISSMEIQLQPESLGKVDLQVTLQDGKMVAEIKTESETVKNIIEGQLIQLKETFEQQGLKVTSVDVSVSQNGLSGQMTQDSDGNRSGGQAKKQNTRRINLQELKGLGDMESLGLNQEEQLAAEIMLQSGNTVDYTA